jgi:hypothetical protein
MTNDSEQLTTMAIFEGFTIRQIWHDDEWYFSVIDVIAALTDSDAPNKYWSAMKRRVKKESDLELSTNCRQLKLPASDGKLRETECANTENMLHDVQHVPSKKAIPFREWLAQVGAERLEEIDDPEKALNEWKERAIHSFMAHGYSEGWARNRVDSLIARNNVTGQWAIRGIKPGEFPILTDRMHMGTFGLSVEEHKEFKGYPVIRKGKQPAHKGDRRSGMTALELAVITFAENVSTGLRIERDSQGFAEVARDVGDAASLARENRLKLEEMTGQPVVSATNMLIERDGGLWSLLPPPEDA